MVGQYYWFTRHELAQVLGDSDGQGRPACYSPWGHKESDMTEKLNNKYKYYMYNIHIIFLCIYGSMVQEL